jgi:hypothetical protein
MRPSLHTAGVAVRHFPVSIPVPSASLALALLWSAVGMTVSTVALTGVPGELLSEQTTATQLAEAFAPPAAKFSPITDLRVPGNLPTLVGADPI